MSDWCPVLSGVPQSSSLDPILLIIYIKYLDVNVISYVLKLASDANILSEVSTLEKVVNLR